jgi:hypothetical protein
MFVRGVVVTKPPPPPVETFTTGGTVAKGTGRQTVGICAAPQHVSAPPKPAAVKVPPPAHVPATDVPTVTAAELAAELQARV